MAHARGRQSTIHSVRSTIGPVTSVVLAAGAVMILLGAALQTGVWAGMFGIIGGLLIAVAITFRILLWAYRQF